MKQRRRARVRKAQQAFQKRKEAAVQSLEGRLGAVQNGLEEFSNAFSDFSDAITETGIGDTHPDILRQLHNLTERLLALANAASPQSPIDVEEGSSGPGGPSGGGGEGGGGSGGTSGPEDPSSGGQIGPRGSFSIQPGLEHLFLSDADPSPSYSSPEGQSGYSNIYRTMLMAAGATTTTPENAAPFDAMVDFNTFASLWEPSVQSQLILSH